MNRANTVGAVVLAASVTAGCAIINVPVHRGGGALVNAEGMTLYTFDRDRRGESACDAKCATSWPPLVAVRGAKAAGEYTIIVRDDGRRQWAYKGKPLYASSLDRKPGDQAGEAFDNVWRVARP